MIETYAFFAAFLLQILAMSVLYPAWLIWRARVQATCIPTERFAQLFPGVDLNRSVERFATRYRAVTTGIALLGLVLLGWLFNLMRHPDWPVGSVKGLVTAYFMLQASPLLVVAVLSLKYRMLLRRASLEGKRTAILQRRGLFDFVSPFVVFVAVLGYVLFVAFVLYLRQHPFPGFAGLVNIGAVTLVYALNAYFVYKYLYGRKNPLQTHEGRVHMIGVTVKSLVYTCIGVVVFLSLIFTLALLDLRRWEPFSLSVFFVAMTLLCLMGLAAPPRKPDADGLASDGQLTPEPRDLSA